MLFPELMVRAVGAGRIWGYWGKRCLYGGCFSAEGCPPPRSRSFTRSRADPPPYFPVPGNFPGNGGQAGGRGSDGEAAGDVAASLSAGTLPTATGGFLHGCRGSSRRVFQSDTLIFCGGCVIIKYQSAGRILLCGSRRISGKPVPAGQERRSRDAQ